MIKRYGSRLNLLPILKGKFELRSYQTLLILFISGLLLILVAYYTLYELKISQLANLEAEAQELSDFIYANQDQKERLPFPELANQVEAMNYAKKVPMERELPRFLIDLDHMAHLSGINIKSMRVDEVRPEQKDLVTVFLTELGKLAKDLKEPPTEENKQQNSTNNPLGLSGLQQKERIFVTDPETLLQGYLQGAEQKEGEDSGNLGVTEIPKELAEYIPFGMIHFQLETAGTYRQLANFLGMLRTNDRLVHVEKWEYDIRSTSTESNSMNTLPMVTISFKIFYYKEKVKDIPQLAPLDWKEGESEAIIAVPKSWLETTQDGFTEDEQPVSDLSTPNVETDGASPLRKELESFIQKDPVTKD